MIPEGITVIEKETFSGCSWLESVTIPESVKTISEKAFYQCGFLEELYLPKVTYIGSLAFKECKNLKTATFGEGLKTIDDEAFYSCIALARISLPEGLNTIGSYSFEGCKSLESLKIPEGVTNINNQAFRNGFGSKLHVIYLPSSLVEMHELAFFGNDDIKKIYCAASTPPYAIIPKYLDMNIGKPFSNEVFTWAELYVPTGKKNVYSTTPAAFYNNEFANGQHDNTFWGLFFSIDEFNPETFDFETLGISSTMNSMNDNHQNAQIHNISGQLVRSNSTSTDGLPRGIYIVNGKKVAVTR